MAGEAHNQALRLNLVGAIGQLTSFTGLIKQHTMRARLDKLAAHGGDVTEGMTHRELVLLLMVLVSSEMYFPTWPPASTLRSIVARWDSQLAILPDWCLWPCYLAAMSSRPATSLTPPSPAEVFQVYAVGELTLLGWARASLQEAYRLSQPQPDFPYLASYQ